MDLAALVSDCRRWGFARAAFIRLSRGLGRYVGLHVYRIFVRPLERDRSTAGTPLEISIRRVRAEELDKASDDPEMELSPEFIMEALERGDAAFGAFDGDALVAYTWRTSTAVPHADGFWAKADSPNGYGYKAFTRESYRGRGLSGAISFTADAFGLERGYTGNVGFVEVTNFASLAVERGKRCQTAGYAGYVKWFRHSYSFRNLAARNVGFEFFLKPGKISTQASAKEPAFPVTPAS